MTRCRRLKKDLKDYGNPIRYCKKLEAGAVADPVDVELDKKVNMLLADFDEYMNDDFNTAKVLANMFELVPVINSLKGGQLSVDSISKQTFVSLQTYFKNYLENIFGLMDEPLAGSGKLDGVLELLIDIRKHSRSKKDYATSDKIRNQLLEMGILLKDEKDGSVSYGFE